MSILCIPCCDCLNSLALCPKFSPSERSNFGCIETNPSVHKFLRSHKLTGSNINVVAYLGQTTGVQE